jgi:hypothetical protein
MSGRTRSSSSRSSPVFPVGHRSGILIGVGKGVATLCLLVGALLAAVGFGWVPNDVVRITAPRDLVAAGGLVLGAIGFFSLARDHRASETLTSLLLLAIAVGAGWLTFFAPEGTLNRYLPFVPPTVNEALARLLFGLGAAICVGMAFWGFRRILR